MIMDPQTFTNDVVLKINMINKRKCPTTLELSIIRLHTVNFFSLYCVTSFV